MALNVITAKFCSGSTQTWTDEAYQYDYGQVLQFDGLELPDAYEVHFSNTPLTGETITQIGGADGVSVQNGLGERSQNRLQKWKSKTYSTR